MADDDTDIATDIAAAFDAVEGAESEEGSSDDNGTEASAAGSEAEDGAADTGGDDKSASGGKDAGSAGDEGVGDETSSGSDAAGSEGDQGDKSASGEDESGATDTKDAAPIDWTPELREKWGKLDPDVKAQINKREADVNTMLMEGAGNRKMGEAFNQITQPYISLMQAEGAKSPLHAVDGLLKTVGTLRLGSAQQKATEMARLIGVYGIDLKTLDAVLVGEDGGDPDTAGFEALLDDRLRPVTDFIRNVSDGTARAEQERLTKGADDVADFSKTAEFINDVRVDMADLMDLAAKRGTPLTLKDAYDKACTLNPQVKAVLDKRAADTALLESAEDTAKKKAAGSSINGEPGAPAAKGGMNLREQIEDAWDEHA